MYHMGHGLYLDGHFDEMKMALEGPDGFPAPWGSLPPSYSWEVQFVSHSMPCTHCSRALSVTNYGSSSLTLEHCCMSCGCMVSKNCSRSSGDKELYSATRALVAADLPGFGVGCRTPETTVQMFPFLFRTLSYTEHNKIMYLFSCLISGERFKMVT